MKKQSKSCTRLVVVLGHLSFASGPTVYFGAYFSVYFESVFPLLRGLLEVLHITCLDLGAYTGVFSL